MALIAGILMDARRSHMFSLLGSKTTRKHEGQTAGVGLGFRKSGSSA